MNGIPRYPIVAVAIVRAVSAWTSTHDDQQDIDQIFALIEHATKVNKAGNVDANG